MILYERIQEIVQPYLGEKTEKFLARQCRIHMHVDAEQLTDKHLSSLARWVGISASLLVSTEEADIMRRKIEALARQ